MPTAWANLLADEYTSGSVVDGKYVLLRPLGEGGMGSVWAAHSNALDVPVAIKLIRVEVANEEMALRLLREARVMGRLADPGIVRVFDVGQTEQGQPYIAMELLAGATLREVMDASRIDAVRAVRLLLPIVRALECAHRAGVVHRDVKPENIVLARGTRGDLQPKLLDFGAAKLVQDVDRLTRVGTVVGSPLYMSPEQARGETTIDHRTDLWSVCAVLYDAVVGEPPFSGANTNALLHAIHSQEVREPKGVFDAALWIIVRRGLTKNRDERWQDARDLMLELAAWLRTQGATEDITGTALRGRGVGVYSSMPGGHPGGDPDGKARALVTGVVIARGFGLRAAFESLASGPKRARLVRPLRELWRGSFRYWSAIAALVLLAGLLGVALRRSAEVPDAAQLAPTETVVALPPRALPLPTPAPEAVAAPSDGPDSEAFDSAPPERKPAARTTASGPTTPATRAPRANRTSAGAGREAGNRDAPARTPARASKGAPFKNPFE